VQKALRKCSKIVKVDQNSSDSIQFNYAPKQPHARPPRTAPPIVRGFYTCGHISSTGNRFPPDLLGRPARGVLESRVGFDELHPSTHRSFALLDLLGRLAKAARRQRCILA
jgi:hypothetical protein